MGYAEHLYDKGDYDSGITEFQRFLFFHPDHKEAFYARYKIAMAYKALKEWPLAIAFFQRSLQGNNQANIRAKIRYQTIVSLILNRQLDSAKMELFRLIHQPNIANHVRQSGQLLYGLLLIFQNKWADSKEIFEALQKRYEKDSKLDSIFQNLTLEIEKIEEKPILKSTKTAEWLSTFLPGAGQIYAGKIGAGLNALALNALTGYWLTHSIKAENIRDSILILSLVTSRYYLGNRLHAKEAVIRTNQEYQQRSMTKIVDFVSQISGFISGQSLEIDKEEFNQ